jgi:serine phosphatase RsbU (regulator of sigma subunit)
MKNIFLHSIYISACCLLSLFCNAQQNKIDSLKNVLKNSKEDTNKVNVLNKISNSYSLIQKYNDARNYDSLALDLAEKLNFRRGIVQANIIAAKINVIQGDYTDAMSTYVKTLAIADSIDFKKGIADAYNGIGMIYLYQNNYNPALENHLKCLKIREEMHDAKGISGCYNNIGIDYEYLENYKLALDYFKKTVHLSDSLGDKKTASTCESNIGTVYYMYAKADTNQLHQPETINKDSLLKLALDYCLKSLDYQEKVNYKLGIEGNYANMGNIYSLLGDNAQALLYLNKSLAMSKEMHAADDVMTSYSFLTDYYEKIGDYKTALQYHKQYSLLRDSLISEKQDAQLAELSTRYESTKKDKEILERDRKISQQRNSAARKKIYLFLLIGGIVVLLAFSIIIFRNSRNKQIANLELDKKNKNITDSITYANRIQQAILPSKQVIESFLPDSFIFYKPKDIVSGDFYWFSEKEGKLILAVADCTGHGVPGAFMSMIGNTLLNEIVNVKNIIEPENILNELNTGIANLLQQNNTSANTQEDGMDISIITINRGTNEILFAGANHLIDVITDANHKTIAGDIYSIGGMFGKKGNRFSSRKINIQKGMCIYLSTDGFQDQFGGEKNSKFLSTRFEKLLLEIHAYPMAQQKEKLTEAFENWKGNTEQLDDVLVMGVRI